MTPYTVPYLPDASDAYLLQKLYMTQDKQDIQAYDASIKRYANTVAAIDLYLLQMAQEYRACFTDGNLLGMATALQASEKAAWSRKYLTLTHEYLAWRFKSGVMHIDIKRLMALPPPPKVVEITPVRVPMSINGVPFAMEAGDHIATLTGTAERREQALELA